MGTRSIAAIGLLCFALTGAVAQVQVPNPLTLPELQRLAALPEAQQRTFQNQSQLMNWFLANCQAYMNSVQASAVGRSALIAMGPPAWRQPGGQLQRLLLPPYGQGAYYFVFSAAAGAPGTLDDHWQFPLQPASLTIQNQDTCWEEMQHALLGQSRAYTQQFDMGQWGRFLNFRSANQQEEQEHIFIDAAANTAAWLTALAAFETEVRRANEQRQGKYREVRMNLALEHHIWRDAFLRWSVLWSRLVQRPGGANRVDFLTAPMRQQYETITATRLPTINQVIAFYMNGELTDDATTGSNRGNPIHVPEWVMARPHPARLVLLQGDPATPMPQLVPADPAKGTPERLECNFTIRLIDTYLPYGRQGGTSPVFRGKLSVFVRLPLDMEKEAGFQVRLGNNRYPLTRDAQGHKAVVIDLAQAYSEALKAQGAEGFWTLFTYSVQPLDFCVSFFRDNPSTLQGDKRYELAVHYEDEETKALGPAVYDNSQAVYFITLKAGGATSAGTAGTGAGTTKPGWNLLKHWVNQSNKAAVDATTATTDSQLGKVTETLRYRVNAKEFRGDWIRDSERATLVSPRHREYHLTSAWDYSAPPQSIPFGSTFKTTWTLKHTETWEAGGHGRPTGFAGGNIALRLQQVGADGVALLYGQDFSLLDRQTKLTADTTEYTWAARTPSPERPQLLLSAGFLAGDDLQYMEYWLYGSGQASAPPTQAQVTRQDTNPPAIDADHDNVPPVDKEEEKPPPEDPVPGANWYTHPDGTWRVLLRGSWSRETAEDFDVLAPKSGAWKLHVRRTPYPIAGPLKQAMPQLNPPAGMQGEKLTYLDLRGAEAAARYVTKPGWRGWSLYFSRGSSIYLVYALPGPSASTTSLGDQCLKVMETIQFLRAETGTGANTGTGTGATTAPITLSGDVTDTTGQLTPAQVTDLRHALSMLTLQHNLKLAVVMAGPLSAAQAAQQAGQYREQLIAAGKLPAVSGLLLYSSDGARGYSRNTAFDKRLPLAVVKQAWEDAAQVQGLSERVATQLRRIRELLGQ